MNLFYLKKILLPVFEVTIQSLDNLEDLFHQALKEKEASLQELGANEVYCIYRMAPLKLKDTLVVHLCMFGVN